VPRPHPLPAWLLCSWLGGCGPLALPDWPWSADDDTGRPVASPFPGGPGAAPRSAFRACPEVTDPPTAKVVAQVTAADFVGRALEIGAVAEVELEPSRHRVCGADAACPPTHYTNAGGVEVAYRRIASDDELRTELTVTWPTGDLHDLTALHVRRGETFESWSFDWTGAHPPFGRDRSVEFEMVGTALRYRAEDCRWTRGEGLSPELGDVVWVWAGGDDQLFVNADDVAWLRDLSRLSRPPWCIGQLDPDTWELVGDCPE